MLKTNTKPIRALRPATGIITKEPLHPAFFFLSPLPFCEDDSSDELFEITTSSEELGTLVSTEDEISSDDEIVELVDVGNSDELGALEDELDGPGVTVEPPSGYAALQLFLTDSLAESPNIFQAYSG